jgi:SAM-dependent methyltransferase
LDAARPDLPNLEQSQQLAAWLAGPRGRLLRRAQIGLRKRVLEFGCGYGVVTRELARRCPGEVFAIDRSIARAASGADLGARLIEADAAALPFAGSSLDLVFSQNVLLWVDNASQAVREAARVLQLGGALVAIEPDFGGMIEHPPEIALQDVWLRALTAAGADPLLGRKLPGMCESAGLEVWVELQAMPRQATPAAMRLLDDMPLADSDRARVISARQALSQRGGGWGAFIHVPYFLIVATKP